MADCKFCKIAAGEIPSYKLFETDEIFVFLDIHPESRGHMLVIPKKHWENMYDIPETILSQIIITTKKIAAILKENNLADGVDITNANGEAAQQSVFHYHLHLLPRKFSDGLDCAGHSGYQENNIETVFNDFKIAFEKNKNLIFTSN